MRDTGENLEEGQEDRLLSYVTELEPFWRFGWLFRRKGPILKVLKEKYERSLRS